jgi:hypothetical protein
MPWFQLSWAEDLQKELGREFEGNPLQEGSKLETCAADARKRISEIGNKSTKSNRTVIIAWHGKPMRDPGLVQAQKSSFEGGA